MKYLCLIFLISCQPLAGLNGPKNVEVKQPSDVRDESSSEVPGDNLPPEIDPEEERQRRLSEMKNDWLALVSAANESYQDILPTLSYKCFDCHDSNRRLRFYARVFPRINPLFKHQKDGLAALDFVSGFPLTQKTKAALDPKSASYQISLLNSLKNSMIDRSMPLKSYRLVYRRRRVFDQDEIRINSWADKVLEDLKQFQREYADLEDDGTPAFKARRVFEAKCYRCHANGVARGGFGEMEDLQKLAESNFIDRDIPENSELYKIIESGEMPTNPREGLTESELLNVLTWIREL